MRKIFILILELCLASIGIVIITTVIYALIGIVIATTVIYALIDPGIQVISKLIKRI